jgi:membrane associated rhomboid family serine protease
LFILPYNQENQVRNPWVLFMLMAINIGVFIVSLVMPNFDAFLREYGYIPAQPHVYTVFTSMFLHAGFWHIVGNMWFLWMFGNQVENSLGRFWFAVMYILSGIAAVAGFAFLEPNLTVPLVGASGAISGVAGAYVMLFPNNKFDLDIYFLYFKVKTIPSTAKVAVGAWFGEQLLLTAVSQVIPSSTAFAAHVAGFLFGVLVGLAFNALVPAEKRLALAEGKEWNGESAFESMTTLDLTNSVEEPKGKHKAARHGR